MDSAGTATYKRDGAGVTAPVLSDSSAVYTPGISERRSSTTKFYGTDRLGTNSLETNSSQTVTSTKTYDAFGMLQASTGSSASPFGFAGAHGYQEDGDSGLKLLGHRYYDASTGRFLTRDPIKDGRNWYAYCENNPLKFADPEGLVLAVVVAIALPIPGFNLGGESGMYFDDDGWASSVSGSWGQGIGYGGGVSVGIMKQPDVMPGYSESSSASAELGYLGITAGDDGSYGMTISPSPGIGGGVSYSHTFTSEKHRYPIPALVEEVNSFSEQQYGHPILPTPQGWFSALTRT